MAGGIQERSKVVVRKLPPTLREEDFRAAVDDCFEDQYDWFAYIPGKASLRSLRHSRAYLNFKDPLKVYDFRAKFDGHTFVSERGAHFSCTVEYSPYQKVPKKARRQDPREGTLEKDAEYQEFLEGLEKGQHAGGGGDEEASVPENGKRVTPLMQYLHDKWTGRLAAQSAPSKRRQKVELAFDENLAPPPGFDPLPRAGARAHKAAASSHGEASPAGRAGNVDAAHEAVATAMRGVSLGGEAEQPSAKARPQKKKAGAKKGVTEGEPEDAHAPEAPKKILRNPASAAAEPPRPQPRDLTEPPRQPQSAAPAAPSRRAPPKAVRVRAGFQVYTPKVRSETEEPRSNGAVEARQTAERSADQNGNGHVPEGRQGGRGRPPQPGNMRHTLQKQWSGEAEGKHATDEWGMGRGKRGQRRKQHKPTGHGGGWDATANASEWAPSDGVTASAGDSWGGASDGPEWVVTETQSKPPASTPRQQDSGAHEFAEASLSAGGWDALVASEPQQASATPTKSRGGRRNWRADPQAEGGG